jgi:hypothetical protein
MDESSHVLMCLKEVPWEDGVGVRWLCWCERQGRGLRAREVEERYVACASRVLGCSATATLSCP